jgi:hypothetical protein
MKLGWKDIWKDETKVFAMDTRSFKWLFCVSLFLLNFSG